MLSKGTATSVVWGDGAGRVGNVIRHVAGCGVRRGAAKEMHLARDRIDFGVHHHVVRDGAAKVVETARLQGHWINFVRQAGFPRREDFAAMTHDGGVGCIATELLSLGRDGLGLEHRPEQRFTCGPFGYETFSTDPAIDVVDATVVDVKGMDHAVAVVPIGVVTARCELRVRAVAVEGATQICRERARDREIVRLTFQQPWYRVALEGVRERLAHRLFRSVAFVALFRGLAVDDDLLRTSGRCLEVLLAIAHPGIGIAALGVVTLEVRHDVAGEQFV